MTGVLTPTSVNANSDAFKDIVKLSHLSPESGIVTAVDIQCGLLHALSKAKVPDHVSHKLLTGAIAVEVGDRWVLMKRLIQR